MERYTMFLEWNNQYCEKNYTIKVQLLSHLWLFWTPWSTACQASLSITNSWSLLKLMSIKSVMPSNIPSSITSFFSCLQSFPASGSFPVSQFFASGGQSTGDSALASILPMNIQNRFPLGWTGLTPCCPRDSQESSPAPQFKSINSSALSLMCAQLLRCALLLETPWTVAYQAPLSMGFFR